jgi:hypothetical protein
MTAKFKQAELGPFQVVILFYCSLLQFVSYLGVAAGQGLTLIQRLGGDFTTVIDTHQSGDVLFLRVRETAVIDILCRVRAAGGMAAAEQGAQGGIRLQDKVVES